MALLNAAQAEALIAAATAPLLQRIDQLDTQIGQLTPPVVNPILPVVINPQVDSGNASLDLIKSLPDFAGDADSYPAWRNAAEFAMKYYPENSEKFYVATGILRNKITGTANTTLSSFNTVLNVKAIIARLDQTYADKRPLHVLENELSILNQSNSSIVEFYDIVDKQLTLILNKQIMSFHGQTELVAALNERARENALRVFISGLRRPLCDILFSAKPKDLPNALVTAQELETNHRRNDFARTYAVGNFAKSSKNRVQDQFQQYQKNKPVPMEVDSSKVMLNKNRDSRTNTQQRQQNYPNYSQQRLTPFQNLSRSFPNPNTGAIPKRGRENSFSNRSPFYKQQRINHMPDAEPVTDIDENSSSEDGQISDFEDDFSDNEINFLG